MEFTGEAKPSTVGLNNDTTQRSTEVKPLFWFEKNDGIVFCCDEKEAWNIYAGYVRASGPEGIRPVRHKYKGRSDGIIYWEGIRKIGEVFKTEGVEKAQDLIRSLEAEEYAKADKSLVPRSHDRMDLNGNPTRIPV